MSVTLYIRRMLGNILEHLVTGLQNDLERKRQEAAERRKKETKLYRMLAEMVDTERKYVKDLEETCQDYLPLAGSCADTIQSLDRRQLKKKKRYPTQRPVSGSSQ